MNIDYKYEVQYLDKKGEPVGYECAHTPPEARRPAVAALSRSLQPYELRYAEILSIETGESVSAYRTTPEGLIKQISIDALPEPS